MNLCINASDAMPQGGEIQVQTTRCLISKERADTIEEIEAGPFSRITVSDSGVGMSPEARQRIFEPFFTTKGEKERSGLGLSICHAAVRAHGGFIDVHSRPGEGTVFSVYLPLAEEAAPRETPEDDRIVEGNGTLLLVDDERTMTESTALLLGDIGYSVQTACSGKEAVEVFSENADEIQLILMDLGMPGMDGLEAFMRIRDLRPEARALLLTGLPQSDEAQRALREGFVGIVQKPFRLEELSRKIKDAL
jgi:CheY-like chemotaxis protein